MYIREIRIQKFRHLENVNLGPFEQPNSQSDSICLAGPNGGGKSSILELIGYALSNSYSLSWALNRSFSEFSFEVAIGLTVEEIQLAKAIASSTGANMDMAITLVETNKYYWRGFNMPNGEFAKNQGPNNLVHQFVTQTLRNHYKRSLGFFIKSDRAYSGRGFQRDKIFNYEGTTSVEHTWSVAYNTSDAQYTDVFDFLVQQRYHYLQKLGTHYHKRDLGQAVGEKPSDPLIPYNNLLKQIFPEYSFTDQGDSIPTNLFVTLPSGSTLPFHDLSSGEKEVFFILAFFLRHSVESAIVIVDEPEMHLHPELSRTLMRQMLSVKPANQIWVATHNPEIIDEAGTDRTIFIDRDAGTRLAKVTLASNESHSVQQLRNLFGFSGYLGVGKCLVFLEGEDASTDRKMFAKLFPKQGGSIRFVPAGSSDNTLRLNQAVLSILESNIGWMRYYLIRDRDYLADDEANKMMGRAKHRLYVLKRYHIENYLLNFSLISDHLKSIHGIEMDVSAVKGSFFRIAIDCSAEFLRDIISFKLNRLYWGEDFSIGDYEGAHAFTVDGKPNDGLLRALKENFSRLSTRINSEISDRAGPGAVSSLIDSAVELVRSALFDPGDKWLELFPGRRMIELFLKRNKIAIEGAAFRNSLIRDIGSRQDLIPQELVDVVGAISGQADFSTVPDR
jgi:ABC-type lipoprotein export system ATPase subunit